MPIITASEFKATFFDYIIVGGGTTGLALAVRYVLAESRIVPADKIFKSLRKS